MKKAKMILAFIGMALLTAVLFAGCGGGSKVDLNKYVTIGSEGYDTMGRVVFEFDEDSFLSDNSDKIEVDPDMRDEDVAFELAFGGDPAETLLDMCVDYDLEHADGLKNGDVITLKWNCDDERAEECFNVRLDYSDITYKVSGLKETAAFNPFEYLQVTLDGIAPNGTAKLEPDYDKPEMQYIRFSADKTSGLDNGDVIKVTASTDGSVDSFVEKFGVIPGQTEQEYTVSGLKTYVTTVSQIDESAMNAMISQGRDVFMAYAANSWTQGYVINSCDYVGNYLLTLKEGHSGDNNYLYMIYHINFIEIDGLTYDFYYQVRFRNLVTDGTNCVVDLADYEKTRDRYTYADGKYNTNGYGTVDSLYQTVVQPRIDHYAYEKNLEG